MITINNQFRKVAVIALGCAIISACDTPEVSNPPPLNSGTASNGDADFTSYVAIGDSLTAGYADGALYLQGQLNSYPNILAEQFAAVGGGDFIQPLTADPDDPASVAIGNLGGMLVAGTPDIIQNRFVLNTETELPERLETPVGVTLPDVIGTGWNGTVINNMGVPAAKSFHLVAPRYGAIMSLGSTANPYFVRFSSDPDNNSIDPVTGVTVIGDAAAQMPSFYTLWIGSNDVIWYGFAGGDNATATDQTGNPDPTTYGQNDITDPNVFASAFSAVVDTLKLVNNAVQGVLITVPDVTTIPYFTAVPYNVVPLDQATADLLNNNPDTIAYNAGLQAVVGVVPGFTQEEADARTINFVAGQNAVVIEDKDDLTDLSGFGLPSYRHATAKDRIVFESAPKIGTEDIPGDQTTVWGVSKPLLDADVLVDSEIVAMQNAVTAYNATIKAVADGDPDLLLFDAKAMFDALNTNGGIDYGTGSINSDFATGGAISLDGIHPTARGYAVIANNIIDVINKGFNANVYKVDPGTYPTIFLK